MKVYLKWAALTALDYIIILPPIWLWFFMDWSWWMLLPPFHIAVIFISLFTYKGWNSITKYFSTYDNPPQGDSGFIRERSLFPKETAGIKGYLNRVWWLWRNPNYYFQSTASLKYNEDMVITWDGNENISDKYAITGSYFAKVHLYGEFVGFEYYCVKPSWFGKCLRSRLGWKVMTDKFKELGMAPLVNTCNPLKELGESLK